MHTLVSWILQGATFALLLLLSGTVTAVEGAIGSTQDQSSYSNVDQFAPSHISFNISVNFEDSSTAGTTTQTFNTLEADVTTVYLDVWDGVEVSKAEFQTLEVDGYANFTEVSFEITTPNPNIGNALAVTLPVDMPAGTEFFLRFTYRTNADTTALSWMTPAQTAGKKLPFMYSLCQMNFCRDLAPMMDTPSQKITYDATIIAPSEFVVHMSANETGLMILNDTHTVTTFACDIRLPSYLIAIVVGDLKVQSLSSRVNVMSEPVLLESAVEEFAELPDALAFVEGYLTPYIWGNYTLVIMPPSFAWGGMEHPLVTFASHTLITGDKSQVSVAFHELTHSWFGNDVGCQNWNNFWLNEGLNTFMERKVTSTLRGIDFAKIEYYEGNTSMYFGDMLSYGLDNPFSSLFPDIGDVDPEESFSGIPYEKGSQFAYYMESLIGEDAMQTLLRLYMSTFAQTAIESTDFRILYESFVNETFENATDIINATEWDLWVYGPGLPPVTLDFRTDALEQAQALATAYATLKGESSPDNYTSFFDFFSSQKVIFVQELTGIETVNADLLAYIDSDLNLTTIANPLVKTLWFALGIENGYETVLEPAYIWSGEQGRNYYVKQVFKAMANAGNCDMAKAWLADYETFYNSYVVGTVQDVLTDCDPETNSSGTASPTAASTSEASMKKVATFLGTAGIAIGSFLFLV